MTNDSKTETAPAPAVQKSQPTKLFDPNIEGAVARLHLASGRVIFCDVLLLTGKDVVVTIPMSEAIPDRGEAVRCSLFLSDDDSFVAHREGIVHWEMSLHGQRLSGIFLEKEPPAELLNLTTEDRRQEVRYPANVACDVRGQACTIGGRLVSYSLNGLATQCAEQMEIGEPYTVSLVAGDELIELEAKCRWSIKTGYGYILSLIHI